MNDVIDMQGSAPVLLSTDLTITNPASEWTVYQGKTFSVQVRAWNSNDEWRWNVYALIFEGHRLHQNINAALCLPFHWGATYDKRIVTSPAQGKRYDWEKISDCLKIGSDYMHYEDNYEHCNPKAGIPPMIRHDAQQLVYALLGIEDSES